MRCFSSIEQNGPILFLRCGAHRGRLECVYVICDFIYTKEGLRIPSGDAVITITGPDGVTRTLVVVRSGKGRSRLDRWSDQPRPDGVVGEINTRDLQEWMELSNSREIPGKITVDGVELDVMLDAEAMMGRAGRQRRSRCSFRDSQ